MRELVNLFVYGAILVFCAAFWGEVFLLIGRVW
jgi:hypothetical protein